MKQTLILFAMIVFTSSFMSPAKIGVPKSTLTPGTYSFMTDGDLTGSGQINLEQSSATYQTGKGKTTAPVISISGLRSNYRFGSGMILKFRTHYDSGPMPPDGLVLHPYNDVMLYKFNVDKRNRTSATPIQILFTAVDNVTYRIDIAGGIVLSKGEYAFVDKTTVTSTGNVTVWCFGID